MAKKKFNYTKALEQLNGIIASLEEGKIPIEKLHKEVETAQSLIKECREYLRKIETDVNELLEEDTPQ